MLAIIVLVGAASGGALTGVTAQTAAECSQDWLASCERHADYQVHPELQSLPECQTNEDCIMNGLTGCGYDERGVTKVDNVYIAGDRTNREMWLTTDGDLNSAIINTYQTPSTPDETCGTHEQQVSYLDPLISITVSTTGSTETTTQNGFTSCYAHSSFQSHTSGGVQYPDARRNGVASCRKTNHGRPTCRCRHTPRSSGVSDCKKLHDEAGTSTEKANRLRAFQAINQCMHYEAPQCSSKDQCLSAGANLNKQCSNSSPCTTNQRFISASTSDATTSVVCEVERTGDIVNSDTNLYSTRNSCSTDGSSPSNPVETNKAIVNAGLVPGSADERCTCSEPDCYALWQDYITRKTANDADGATQEERDTFTIIERQMTALENAGNCRGGRPGTRTTTTPKPDYSMHIGIIAGIAAGSVAVAALITSALICILMYACRSDSHVETQARNQRAMMGGAAPGGQSAIYGRSAYGDMEMTHRRSRAY